MTRYADGPFGKKFSLPETLCGCIYLSAHVSDYGKRVPRVKFSDNRPWYNKISGFQKKWTYKIYGDDK